MYERLTGRRVWEEPWPDVDPEMLVAETFELVCQVMTVRRCTVVCDELARIPVDVLRQLARLAPL